MGAGTEQGSGGVNNEAKAAEWHNERGYTTEAMAEMAGMSKAILILLLLLLLVATVVEQSNNICIQWLYHSSLNQWPHPTTLGCNHMACSPNQGGDVISS